MADTTYLKHAVETFVRGRLAEEYGSPFASRVLTLVTGGTHEFDAVSDDGRVVAAIKSASGRTSGSRVPSGKIKDAEAELYYLSLVSAPVRLLVLTNSEFHGILTRRLSGRLAPGISLKLIPLPVQIQQEVTRVQTSASREVVPPRLRPRRRGEA